MAFRDSRGRFKSGKVVFSWDNRKATRIVDDALDARMRKLGAEIKAIATGLVPVDTGYLKSTIYYRYFKDRRVLEVGARASYAWYVEQGTKKMAAQPFIGPAMAQAEAPGLQRVMTKAVFASERPSVTKKNRRRFVRGR
jgi:HK97 gp10 family phage protein